MRFGSILFLVFFLFGIPFGMWLSSGQSLRAQEVMSEAEIGSAFTYQGLLVREGNAVNGACRMSFRLFDAQNDGVQVGSEQVIDPVSVSNGLFTVVLNGNGEFGPDVTNGQERWLQISLRCGDEPGDTVLPRQAIRAAPYALTALSAEGLAGRGVSAAAPANGQVLGWNGSEWAPQNAANSTAWDQLTGVPAGFADSVDDDALGGLNCTTDQVAHWDGSRWGCSDLVKNLAAEVTELKTLLAHFHREGDDIIISGANLYIVDGSGTTSSTTGLGNLIIGYNESRIVEPDKRTGSHMLVIGMEHNYTGFGGIIVGQRNETSKAFASVYGGVLNTASGHYAVVSGGAHNTASGDAASVTGGTENTASGQYASVTGGSKNTASEYGASVSGGKENKASGFNASVSGGSSRAASSDLKWAAGSLSQDY